MGRTLVIVTALVGIALGGYFMHESGKQAAPIVGAPIERMNEAKQQGVEQNLAGAAQYLEQQRALNGTYVGVDLGAFAGIRLVSASDAAYCIEAGAPAALHISGPNGAVTAGGC